MAIDAVLTWVDGNDPALKKLKSGYITHRKEDQYNDLGGPQRYVQAGEIRYAVASILKFAPFVKRIFIVTPGQRPPLDDFLKRNFPHNQVPIEIIHQDSLFAEYKNCLPVFNSLAVEAMLWRIPDLSEEFIYMNDDFFFAAPCKYEDLFSPDGKVILYSKKFPGWWAKFLRVVRKKRADGKRRFTYKDSLWNGAEAAGLRHYYHLPHEPHPLLKSLYAQFFETHPEVLLQNVRHRFRDNEQYNVQSLGYALAEKAGKLVHKSASGLTIKFQPSPRKKDYMARKLKEAAKMKHLKFACMNDLQNAPQHDRDLFWQWMTNLLKVDFS